MKKNKERVKLAKRYQKELIDNATYYEKKFIPYLKGISYEFQKIIFVSDWTFFIVDFYIPKFKTVIEIDGIQHKSNKDYDAFRTKQLKLNGIRKVIRFTNIDIRDMEEERIKQIIKINLLA